MNAIPFQTTDWNAIESVSYQGESGVAHWKTISYPRLRIRQVRYSENYKANHWCSLGHIVFCIEGEFVSELSDGRSFALSQGMSYQVSAGSGSHRSTSKKGATLLIIDGEFLNRQKNLFNPWKG